MDWISTNILSILNLLVLIALSLFGRNWVNQKSEEIKALYSKKEIIYRMRIEKEYEIYQQLWEKLWILRESMANASILYASKFDKGIIEQEEIQTDALKRLSESHTEAMQVIHRNIPFYEKKLLDYPNKLLKVQIFFPAQ